MIDLMKTAQEMIEVAKANSWNPLRDGMLPAKCRRDIEYRGRRWRLQCTETELSKNKRALQVSVSDLSGKLIDEQLAFEFKTAFFTQERDVHSLPSTLPHVLQWMTLHETTN